MKLKMLVRFFVAGLVIVTLTGCFDIEQHVTSDSKGNVLSHVTFRMQKALFELAAQMGGDPIDYSDMLEDSDLTEEDFLADVPGVLDSHYETVNTPGHFGFYAQFSLSKEVTDMIATLDDFPDDPNSMTDAVFVPFRMQNGLAIVLETLGDDADEQSAAFLASATYNLTIGKSILNNASTAVVLPAIQGGFGDPVGEYPVKDFQDYYSVDIPLSAIMGSSPAYVIAVQNQ